MTEVIQTVPSTTLRDVAQRAGVSLSTASRVLNGATGVSDDLAERVRAAAAALNYHPNIAARSLRVAKTMALGVLFHRLESPVALDAWHGIEDSSQEHGYSLLVTNAHGDVETARTLLRRLYERRVDGLFIYRPTGVRDALRPYEASGIPIVALFARGEGCEDIPIVRYGPGTSNRDAVHRLHALGHRSFVYLATPLEMNDQRARELARFAEELGMAFRLQTIPDTPDEAGMAAALRAIREFEVPPTAVFARYRHVPFLVAALRAMHLSIPDDYSLVSFGDSEWLTAFDPPIAAIQGDGLDLGRTAMRAMLAAMEGEALPDASHSEPSYYYDRASVGAAPVGASA